MHTTYLRFIVKEILGENMIFLVNPRQMTILLGALEISTATYTCALIRTLILIIEIQGAPPFYQSAPPKLSLFRPGELGSSNPQSRLFAYKHCRTMQRPSAKHQLSRKSSGSSPSLHTSTDAAVQGTVL